MNTHSASRGNVLSFEQLVLDVRRISKQWTCIQCVNTYFFVLHLVLTIHNCSHHSLFIQSQCLWISVNPADSFFVFVCFVPLGVSSSGHHRRNVDSTLCAGAKERQPDRRTQQGQHLLRFLDLWYKSTPQKVRLWLGFARGFDNLFRQWTAESVVCSFPLANFQMQCRLVKNTRQNAQKRERTFTY